MTLAASRSLIRLHVRPNLVASARAGTAPATGLAATLAAVAAEALGHDHVALDADFFDDLGADSLSMARFCARVRRRPELPAVAMRDVYRSRSVGALAASLGAAPRSDAAVTLAALDAPTVQLPPITEATGPDAVVPVSAWRHVGFGIAQAAAVLAWSYPVAAFLTWAFGWLSAATTTVVLVERALAVGVGGFAAACVVPVAAKWILVGRWTARRIPLWTPAHLRFWIVKTLVRASPMVLFVGSPLYLVHLRALGARIGRGVVILSAHVPVCTDLLSVGAGTVIRKDCRFAGYRVLPGYLETGPVTLGRDVAVGEMSVLDVGSEMGDGATLAHASALHSGQQVPAGGRYHGSPAEPTDTDHRRAGTRRCGSLRRATWSALELALVLAALVALVAVVTLLLRDHPLIEHLIEPGPAALRDPVLLLAAVALPAALYLAALLLGLVVTVTVPRLLATAVPPDRDHVLYGARYLAHRLGVALGNAASLNGLFGDSAAAPHWLAATGWRLRPIVQTGTNFGMLVKQESTVLCSVGPGTVVADGLSMMNAEYSGTAFRVSRAEIGARSFLGNNIAYPAGARAGDDCLLATKVMVPIDGPVRSDVGLLGSPAFPIPRTVARDSALEVSDPHARERALRAKRRHNAVTMALHLAVRLVYAVLVTAVVAATASLPVRWGAVELVVVEVAGLLVTVAWWVLVERCVIGLVLHAPDGCSIYRRDFWRHERYWKVPSQMWFSVFDGTPLKPVMWRLVGARYGARVFDDGAAPVERPFVSVGDDTVLGDGVVLQAHSQEDGGFKSDVIVVGARCALAPAAFVHYGTVVADDVVLEADTFLMKGEEVPAGARWGGNPARALSGAAVAGRVATGGARSVSRSR